ncbi:hypothetical protein [Kocuria massiliensis]|uniref:hypothetical protein n=1 Tax=Kocuria massiliensis TaxID=1926282 RepID=UPI000A1C8A63|nr:hypothetical protein [Kocuria massiliensis]
MNRTTIEVIKAVACLIVALLSVVLAFTTHQPLMFVVFVVLAIATGWFWWKATYFSKNPPSPDQ